MNVHQMFIAVMSTELWSDTGFNHHFFGSPIIWEDLSNRNNSRLEGYCPFPNKLAGHNSGVSDVDGHEKRVLITLSSHITENQQLT